MAEVFGDENIEDTSLDRNTFIPTSRDFGSLSATIEARGTEPFKNYPPQQESLGKVIEKKTTDRLNKARADASPSGKQVLTLDHMSREDKLKITQLGES